MRDSQDSVRLTSHPNNNSLFTLSKWTMKVQQQPYTEKGAASVFSERRVARHSFTLSICTV